MKVALIFFFKVLVIVSILFIGYYFFFLKPKIEKPQKIVNAQTILSSYKNSLVQNKVSFVELSKLDSNSASFEYDKNKLVNALQKSIENGKKSLETPEQIPHINDELTERYPAFVEETRQIFLDQESLLEKVFATKSFEEGLEIMRSEESIQLLTKQTNLILEYDFWLSKVNDLR